MSVSKVQVPVPTLGDGPLVGVSSLIGPKTVLLSGNFTGSYDLLGSHDDSTFWPIATFPVGGDVPVRQTIPGAFKSVRLRSRAVPSGTVACEVSALAGVDLNRFATVASLPSNFEGTSSPVDLWSLFPPTGVEEDVCFACGGCFRGLLVVEGSLDGVAYEAVASWRFDASSDALAVPVDLEVLTCPNKLRYLRVSLMGTSLLPTTVTVGGRTLSLVVAASPAGVVTAPAGTRAFLDDGSLAWDNVDGGTTWHQVGAGAPAVAEVVTVAKSGGQFTSVAAAVAYVTPLASASTPYTVEIAAGVYHEPPFKIPPYVAAQGLGYAVLVPADNSSDFVSGSPAALLNYVTVYGPSGPGKAAVLMDDPGAGSFLVSNVILIGQGRHGLRVSAGRAQVNVLLNGGGVFDYFVRVDGGGLCVVNSASYHSPAPGSAGYCLYCTGAGSELRVSNSIYDNLGGVGAFVDDDGLLVAEGVQFTQGTTALWAGPNGIPRLLVRATSIRDDVTGSYTTNLEVDTAAAVVHYYGSMSRNKFVLAPGVQLEASFQDVTAGSGGTTTIGNVYASRSANPNVVFPASRYDTDTVWTGLVTPADGGVTRAGGLVLNVAGGRGFVNDDVDQFEVVWGAGTITLDPNTTEYVYVDASGSLQKSIVQPDYSDVVVLAQAVTNATDVVLLTRDEITMSHSLSRTQEYFEDVIGPISLGGGLTTVDGSDPLALDVDPGTFAVGLSERVVAGSSPVTFTYWYQSSLGVWVAVPGQTHVDTGRYNNVASGLVALTVSNYKKDLLYVVSNAGGDEYHVVYGQDQFASQVAAEQGNYPAPPFVLEHYALRSGGVVSLAGAASVTSTTNALPRIGGFIPTAGVTDHGALTGLGNDTHLQYLTTGRANSWHQSTPAAGQSHVTGGNTHAHTMAGDGGQVDHTTLANRGVNTHPQIDSHLGSTANPHSTTASQVGAPPATRLVSAGDGLAGGGDLSADRTLSVQEANGTISVGPGGVAVGTVTDANVAAANKDGLAAVPSMRTLGTGSQQACAGNDSRLSPGASPSYVTPANPAQVSGLAFKMLGLGSTIHLTPSKTGKVRLTISYDGAAVGTGAAGSTKLAYGSGTAPVNGAVATGTVVGGTYSVGGAASVSSTETVITRAVIVTGLTLSTSYWFDLQANCTSGTSAGVVKVEATVEELPY